MRKTVDEERLLLPAQAIPLLRSQLEEAVEKLRHDDPDVDAWERVSLSVVERTFGKHTRNANHFGCSVRNPHDTEQSAQEAHVKHIDSKKGMLRAFIKELEIIPPFRPSIDITRQGVFFAGQTIIADIRLAELRALVSPEFDFRKLIRLCEELNTVSREECYFATAMLTRGLLDHVPPVFGKTSFIEVANNYAGGGKSFKDTMHQLENAARKIADSHLHMLIRNSETLPSAQQVNFAPQLDMLLGEIVRITRAPASVRP